MTLRSDPSLSVRTVIARGPQLHGDVSIRRARSGRGPSFPAYSAIALIAIGLEFVVLKLWHADLRVPFYYAYAGDAISQAVQAKMLLEGWVSTNPLLGAPFGAEFADFPTPSLLHLVLQKIIVMVTRAPALTLNLYYLASFPLCAVTALYALRRIGLRMLAAYPAAILYAFLPGHFERNESHLYYAAYFCVPVAILACLWVALEARLTVGSGRSMRPSRDGWIALGAMAAIGSDNQYHAFFAGTLLVLGAAIALIRSRRLTSAIPAIALGVVLVTSFALNIVPTLLYQQAHGKNQTAFNRLPSEAEIYALTIAQLVLPIENHRLPALAKKRDIYDTAFPILVNENSFATLGAIGTLGFVGLLLTLVIRLGRSLPMQLEALAVFNAFTIAFATVGGFGALFNYYVWPGFRAYNRISPFIGFFALATIAFVLHAVVRRHASRYRTLAVAGAGALIAAGVWDQTSSAFVPPYAASSAQYRSDATLVADIAHTVAPGSAIFELPYVPFPESPPLRHLDPARLGALYLHSPNLRWSGLAVKGRPAAQWQSRTAALDPADLARTTLFSGFSGIVVFRDGYADPDESIGPALAALTGVPPVLSRQGDLAFYSLVSLRAKVEALAPGLLTPDRQAAWRTMTDIGLSYGVGFSVPEKNATSNWRWSDRSSAIDLTNSGTTPIAMHFESGVMPGVARPSHLRVDLDGQQSRIAISATGQRLSFAMRLSPGTHTLTFASDAKRLVAPTDPRPLYFRLVDTRVVTDTQRLPPAVEGLFVLKPIHIVAQPTVGEVDGCYAPESGPAGSWRWCGGEGTINVVNPGLARSARLDFMATAPGSPASSLIFAGPGINRRISLPAAGVPVRIDLRLRPGTTTLRFAANALPYSAPGDRRRLILRLNNLSIRDVH